MARTRFASAPAVLAAAIAAIASGGSGGAETAPAAAERRPNVVLIVTDDQEAGSLADMPFVREHLLEPGLRFERAFASTPVCCPSRASILLGQYAHNHGVLTASRFGGGFRFFHVRGHESSTLATWLRSAGYETFFAGKYLNGYSVDVASVPEGHVPPGWQHWFGALAPQGYRDYRLSENGVVVAYGGEPQDYLTDVLAAKVEAYVRARGSDAAPFFMLLAPFAPHGVPPERVPQPAPRHAGAFAGREAPRGGSFDEADVSDKPRAVRRRARLSAGAVAAIDEHHRLRLRTLLAVDELVERLFGALAARGELERTIVFYTSDNGFHLGQHRGLPGKGSPYEEDIRVPLVARGPGIAAGAREQLVLLSDLAPTIAELAGARIPDGRDARSLVPLLARDAGPGRRAFLIQLWAEAPRAGPHWRGVRTATHKYVEWTRQGEVELYDLVADPHELSNLAADSPPPLAAELAARLAALAACRGDACRRLEDAPLGAASAP